MYEPVRYIYTVADPDTGAVRYVGYTSDPRYSVKDFIRKKKASGREDVSRWIKTLNMRHKVPIFKFHIKVTGSIKGAFREFVSQFPAEQLLSKRR